jgi:hypothetical protein
MLVPSVGHALVGVNVPLQTVLNADEAQFKRVHTVGKKTVPMFGCFGKTDLA